MFRRNPPHSQLNPSSPLRGSPKETLASHETQTNARVIDNIYIYSPVSTALTTDYK